VDVPHGTRIVCRIYANVHGLGDVLARKGIIDDTSVFEEFVQGFTLGKALFDFVDVGAGKDHADEKIVGKPNTAIYAASTTSVLITRYRITQNILARFTLPSPLVRLLTRQWLRTLTG
jgi:hypothetical protein